MGGRRQQEEENDTNNNKKKAQRSKTLTTGGNVPRDNKFRELIGDFKQGEIEKFTHNRDELAQLSEDARRGDNSTDVQDIDVRHNREQ